MLSSRPPRISTTIMTTRWRWARAGMGASLMSAAMLSQNRMIDVRPSNEEVEYKGGIRRDRESGVVLSRASGGLRLSVGTGHSRESLCSGLALFAGMASSHWPGGIADDAAFGYPPPPPAEPAPVAAAVRFSRSPNVAFDQTELVRHY